MTPERAGGGRARAVAHGTMRLLSGQLLARLLDMAVYLLLARRLGVEAFGVYTYAASFALLFNVVTDLGLTTVFTREVSRAPMHTRALLQRTLVIKGWLAPLTLLLVLGVALWRGSDAATLGLVAVLATSMVLGSVAGLFEGLLRAAGHAGRVGLSLAAGSLAGLLVVLAALGFGLDVRMAALAQLAAQVVHLVVAMAATRGPLRNAEPAGTPAERPASVRLSAGSSPRVILGAGGTRPTPPPPPLPTRRALLREALPLALSWVFIALYFRIDAVMLQAMASTRDVGLYGGIYRVFEAFAMLTVGFRSVLFPFMARAADGPADSLAVLCRRSLRLQILFTLLVGVLFTFLARPIVTLVLGAAYADAAPGLAVLIWALPGSYMADTLLHLLIAQRRQTLGTWAVAATALLNVGLNLVLIPRASFVGAAAATVASEFTCFAILFAVFRAGAPRVGLAQLAWRPLLAAFAAAGALFASVPQLAGGMAGLVLGGLIGVLVYTGALVALREFGPDDRRLLRDLLPRRLLRRGARP